MRTLVWQLLHAALFCAAHSAWAQQRSIPLADLRSGSTYMSPDIRAMQNDSFSNPGMLWVEKGEKLWSVAPAGPVAGRAAGTAPKSCVACHGDAKTSMKGVSARYPVFDNKAGKLLNLEGRVNQCRSARQAAPALHYESEELLALTAYVAHQSREMPVNVSIAAAAQPHFEHGRALYQSRMGQMNLACMHCHEWSAGKRLLAETISQGHGNAYPAYRLEWQGIGSLHRRLRACYFGVRAEMPPPGSPELLDLELFLGWRAQGLAVETPGVRR